MPDGPVSYTVKGEVHHAAIEGDELVLETGERFASASGAGRAVNGGVSVNGWRAWQRDGRSIADIHDGQPKH